jgi:hypothetical protein
MCVAVETDTVLHRSSLRESLRLRPELLRRLGWHYVRVHAFELFSDPDAVANRIVTMVGAGQSLITEPIPIVPVVPQPGNIPEDSTVSPSPVHTAASFDGPVFETEPGEASFNEPEPHEHELNEPQPNEHEPDEADTAEVEPLEDPAPWVKAAPPTGDPVDAVPPPTPRRASTPPPPGSDPYPESEPSRHNDDENDEQLKRDVPPHWS